MLAPARLRFKIVTSFAFAALGAVMLVRLAAVAPFSPGTLPAYATALIFCLAGLWRGVIYLRAAFAANRGRSA